MFFRILLSLKSSSAELTISCLRKDLKISPLLEEGKTDTNRHVVDTQGDRITFLWSVLQKELAKKTIIFETHLIFKLHTIQRYLKK